MYAITVPQFQKVLGHLLNWLDKAAAHAEAKKYDVKNVLNSRLAPDQFHFIRQVQIACDVAKITSARLAGQEPPKHEDNEQTIDELRARIRSVTEYLGTLKPEQFEGCEQKVFPVPFPPGSFLRGDAYVIQRSIPNFYFHATTAYAILRHNGIELGKGDFLGKLPYVEA